MNTFLKTCFLAAALLCSVQASQAQTYDLRFVPSVNAAQDTLTLLIQVRVQSGQHPVGTSTLKFSFDNTVLSYPDGGLAEKGKDYSFLAFDAAYSVNYNNSTVTQPVASSVSVNIDHKLGNPGTSISTDFVDACEVRLRILDSTGMSSFAWDPVNTFVFDASTGQEWAQGTLSTRENVQLPVELTTFNAFADGATVELTWATASETNNAGFDVQYAHQDSTTFRSATFVEGHGTSSEQHTYTHRFAPEALGIYRIRLKQVDFDGSFVYLPEVEVAVTQLENARGELVDYLVGAPTPNPFSERTTLVLQTTTAQHIQAHLYNMLGQRLQTVVDRYVAAGATSLTVRGDDLSAGLYLLQIEGETFSETRELVVVR